ncbi:MAG: hypothetical protein R3F39_18475 [Myxococcota bacterium]
MRRLPVLCVVLVAVVAGWGACGDSGVNSGLGQLGDTGGFDGAGGDVAGDGAVDARPDSAPGDDADASDAVSDAERETGPAEDTTVAPDSSGATCGNEVCEPGENALTCRKDCKATGALLCLATDCKSALDACFELPSCVTTASCILDCTDEACREACQDGLAGATSFVVDGLVGCGEGAECFASAGTCPGACGDFVEGATCQCQEDCAVFNDCCEGYEAECAGGATCAEEKCPTQFAACGALPECKAAVTCAAACAGDSGCVVGCVSGKGQAVTTAFNALRQCAGAQCAAPGPECGDGTCNGTETAATCPADCKAGGPVCGDGKCETPETPATCPADCKAGGPECGDGKCETPETTATCPADCKTSTSPLITCIDEQCGAELAACVANTECVKAVTCTEQCAATDQNCVTSCALKGGFGSEAVGLLTCVLGSSCLSGGQSSCGNGTCGQGENTQNCPADCPPGPPDCGNGTCDADETPKNCGEDCAPSTAAEVVACMSSACAKESADCLASQPCADALTCIAGCATPDFNCLSSCAGSAAFQPAVVALGSCGFSEGCLAAGP